MKRSLAIVVTVLSVTFLIGSDYPPVEGFPLVSGVPLYPQQASNLCWAASAQMLMAKMDPSSRWDQCTIVREALCSTAYTTCCTSISACNQAGLMLVPLLQQGFAPVKYVKSTTPTAFEFATLMTECKAGRPFGFVWSWTASGKSSSGNHSMVGIGAGEAVIEEKHGESTEQVVVYVDPLPVPDPSARTDDLKRGGDTVVLYYDSFVKNGKSTWTEVLLNMTAPTTRTITPCTVGASSP